jgi:hypothetical protein
MSAKVPAEHHTCGIYSSDSKSTAEDYGDVLGKVYGWGRYIRHEGGWRAAFAYPNCFFLREEQMNLVDVLKKYHVPIYVSQTMRIYDPAEEGYDADWNAEAHWNCRAAEISAASEERDSGEEDDQKD